ncbi:transcription factor [Ophiostoma piceae UAMH 11346]|uniref:Transcription factor n=1 Tax=Ophiostoma piceae (strain UAMH 11346) TaxID=1262450 RepID=S3CFS2_OPHP1|nr:transcription factor [Ophiostoma piceae UAMH 11346]
MDGSLQVLDIQEKEVGAVRAPAFPSPKPTAAGGFPQPKKRTRFASTFKQRMHGSEEAAPRKPAQATQPPTAAATPSAPAHSEKEVIDRENRERLRDMGPAEIEQARRELMENLDPTVLQMLLRRANLDDASTLPGDPEPVPPPAIKIDDAEPSLKKAAAEAKQKKEKKVLFASVEDADDDDRPAKAEKKVVPSGDDLLSNNAANLAPIASPDAAAKEKSHDHDHDHDDSSNMHFPQAPAVPDLDPNDPNFLENLHNKYFPNLPADPARLAWMAPLPTTDSPADKESPYYPGQDSVAVSQLRFDFRGRLIPPKASREIPVSKGLHHHGVAPEAAGYTIGELARLARSAVPSQRCVAFQTLGRILFRLGKGEWGQAEVDDATTDPRALMSQGIWRSLSEGRVLETLHEAAGVEEGTGHRGSRAYAIEAIWLYEKGGWKERWRGR